MAKSKRRKVEFSKELVAKSMRFWVLVTMYCLIVWTIKNDFPVDIFSGVTTQCGAVILAYMAKAGFENKEKIIKSESEGVDI